MPASVSLVPLPKEAAVAFIGRRVEESHPQTLEGLFCLGLSFLDVPSHPAMTCSLIRTRSDPWNGLGLAASIPAIYQAFYVLGTMLSSLSYLILTSWEENITPILQVRKLRHREVKQPYIAIKWRVWY